MAEEPKRALKLPALPRGFSIEQHLAGVEREAEGIRFVAKVLGEQNGRVLCETVDGVYEFMREDVIEVKPLHRHRDLIIVHVDAHYVLHSTVARLIRARREVLTRDRGLEEEGEKAKVLSVAWDGTHEWRGVSL